jgi:hypothetical protein
MADEPAPRLNAVKLPAFWTARPAAGFRLADAQFAIHAFTDNLTKYFTTW